MSTKKSIDKAHVVERSEEELAAEAAEKNRKASAENTSAAEREANDIETVKFTVNIRGNDVELETVADIMDADAQVSIDQEYKRYANMLLGLLGENQWAKLRAAGMSNRIMLETVLPAWQEATGLGED